MSAPALKEILEASKRIAPYIHRTPVLTCASINAECKAQVYFKCENFQRTGSFKMRGAANAVLSLAEKMARRGVATHSSGNHGAALAKAAGIRGVPAYVVMPRNAPSVKREAVRHYGAHIVLCEPTLEAREAALNQVINEIGASFIHPYNDRMVICGQGTVVLEMLTEIKGGLDVVMAPVGGGGLLSGTAAAVAQSSPGIRVIGVEPANADDAYRSLKAGRILPAGDPCTVADGLRTSLGSLTFPILCRWVERIVTVEEEAIIGTMRWIWERMKIVVEPSSAVPLAALLTRREEIPGERIGIILSGGNVDLDRLPWLS